MDTTERLRQLEALHADGVLTAEEYRRARARILDLLSAPPAPSQPPSPERPQRDLFRPPPPTEPRGPLGRALDALIHPASGAP